jgi:cytochrome c oxidase subunit 4
MSHPHAAHAYDPMDPHGVHPIEHDHGHVVVDWRILVAVLAALLFFTVLTVSAANFEKWIAAEFEVVIPGWINVFVAMSIAVIKASLVMAFFMQLFYDKFLNTVIFLFCLLALALFLGFSALDLGGRGLVNNFTAGQIQPGGDAQTAGMRSAAAPFVPDVQTNSDNMVNHAKEAYIEAYGLPAWEAGMAEAELHYGHHHPVEPVSSPEQTVPRHGLTPGLYDEHAPAAAEHHEAGTHEEPAADNAEPAEEGAHD